MKAAAIALSLYVALPVPAVQWPTPRHAELEETEAASCAAEGGCVILTRQRLGQIVDIAGARAIQKLQEGHTDAACWRRT